MKKIIAIIMFSLWTTGNVNAASVSFGASPADVSVSDVFTIDILGEGFSFSNGGGVNLFYDASILNVQSVSIDDTFWNFSTSTGTIDNVSGQVNDILMSAFPGLTVADFTVATIEFIAVGGGTSSLMLTESIINPWASSGSRDNPTLINSSVTVSAVPVPAAIWLFGSGLLGLIGVAKRNKA